MCITVHDCFPSISKCSNITFCARLPFLSLNVVSFYRCESHPLGPRAVQPHTCDHPRGAPRGLLPDVDGGAGESGHLQHRAAQHRRSPLPMIIGRLDLVLCPMYTHHHKPMQNPTARPPSQRTRGRGCRARINKIFKFVSTDFHFKQQVNSDKVI